MADREFNGFVLTWPRVKALGKWGWDAWAVWCPLLLVGAHAYFAVMAGLSEDAVKTFHKFVSAGLQVVGVALILYSIDSNLKAFQLSSIQCRIMDYFLRFPLIRWQHNLRPANGVSRTWSSGATISVGCGDTSVEGRLKFLETQIQAVWRSIERHDADTRNAIKEAKEEFSVKVAEGKAEVAKLRSQVAEQAGGDLRPQFVGLCWIVHSAVAGYLA